VFCFWLDQFRSRFSVVALHSLKRAADENGFLLQVDVFPFQPENLSEAESQGKCQTEQRAAPMVLAGLHECLRLVGRKNLDLRSTFPRRIRQLRNIARNEEPLLGLCKGRA